MPLAALFATFAALGFIIIVLDFGAKANSPAPSMYRSDLGSWGWVIFIICGLIALACFASFKQ